MFAVPGFASLSTSALKSSTGVNAAFPATPKDAGYKGTGSNDVEIGSKDAPASKAPRNRKRKRSDETAPIEKITSENLGDLWEKIIEKKPKVSYNNSNRKSDKRHEENSPAEEEAKSAVENGVKKDRKTRREERMKSASKNTSSTFALLTASKPQKDAQPEQALEIQTVEVEQDTQMEETYVAVKPQSKKDKKKKKKMKKDEQGKNSTTEGKQPSEQAADEDIAALSAPVPVLPSTQPTPATSTLTPLQQKMRQKLSSARFRHLNQMLYTTPSADSLSHFRNQPEIFDDYHAGFRQQVEAWPENPVEIFISRLTARGKLRDKGYRAAKPSGGPTSANMETLGGGTEKGDGASADAIAPLPRGRDGYTTIVDLGCGDAAIARHFKHMKPRPKLKVLSYDLHAPNTLVTVADIANLPLPSGNVDIAVFCLALMGTNWLQMIEEATRVLRVGGEVWIAEIKSRFARSKGEVDEEDAEDGKKGGKKKGKGKGKKPSGKPANPIDAFVEEKEEGEEGGDRWGEGEQRFIEALSKRGLRLKKRDGTNKMFVLMEFEKSRSQGQWAPRQQERPQQQQVPDVWGRVSMNFKDRPMEEGKEDDILKPCVYKLR